MNWITDPLAQYAAVALGLLCSLYLFVSVKRENHRLRRRLDTERDAYQAVLGSLRSTLNRLEEEVVIRQAEQCVLPPPPPPASLNRTKRSQALRLYRFGESPESIAASLQIPRNEVELLLKLHNGVLQQA